MNVDEIIQKIKEEAKETPLMEENESIDIKIYENRVYQISDFNKYNDEEFIDNVYKKLLNRPADEDGKFNYLNALRSGELSKTEIVISIYFSKEGKKQNITLLGAKKRFFLAQIYKIPFLGYLSKSLFTLLTIPRLIKRINQFENHVLVQIKNQDSENKINSALNIQKEYINEELNKYNNNLLNKIEDKASKYELNEELNKYNNNILNKIEDKASKSEFELYLKSVTYAKDFISLSQKNIEELLTNIKQTSSLKDLNNNLLDKLDNRIHKYDNLYVEFEDQFRGQREEIKDKLKVYLPYINEIKKENEDLSFLDLGCGRGEWLELLKENDFTDLKGIDLNEIMVSISQKNDLNVELCNVIEYLKELPNNYLSVITGFHIIEHLSFDHMMTVFNECNRVLKSNGMIIFETPNPRNILVGSSDFFIDPTHIRPIHPETLKFLVQQTGFKNVNSYIINNNMIEKYDNLSFNTLEDYVKIGRDLVVIGYKL